LSVVIDGIEGGWEVEGGKSKLVIFEVEQGGEDLFVGTEIVA
jgi:hypothetical protein